MECELGTRNGAWAVYDTEDKLQRTAHGACTGHPHGSVGSFWNIQKAPRLQGSPNYKLTGCKRKVDERPYASCMSAYLYLHLYTNKYIGTCVPNSRYHTHTHTQVIGTREGQLAGLVLMNTTL